MKLLGIPVIIEKDDDYFVVSDHVVNMYGRGDTEADAIEDYKSAVREYVIELREAPELGKTLREHLVYLNCRVSF